MTSGIVILEHDMNEGYLKGIKRKTFRKTKVQSIPTTPENNIRRELFVQNHWRIEGIPFAWRKFLVTDYQGNRIEK
jgi:hypothetical protein